MLINTFRIIDTICLLMQSTHLPTKHAEWKSHLHSSAVMRMPLPSEPRFLSEYTVYNIGRKEKDTIGQ